MLWHPKTLQNLAMYNVFFIFCRFSIAGKLPKWPKIPFQYPLALRHPKILEKCRKHHRILVSVRNRFWAPPPQLSWYSDCCYINKCHWAFSVAVLPPNKYASPPKRCGRIYTSIFWVPLRWANQRCGKRLSKELSANLRHVGFPKSQTTIIPGPGAWPTGSCRIGLGEVGRWIPSEKKKHGYGKSPIKP